MRAPPPPPPPPPQQYFHGFNTRWLMVGILVPLAVVSALAFDFRTSASWFSSYSPKFDAKARESGGASSVTATGGGGGGGDRTEEGVLEVHRGLEVGEKSSFNISGHGSSFPVLPMAAPSPAPEQAASFSEDSRKNESPPVRRERTKDIRLERLELGLARARAAIREAVQNPNHTSLWDKDYVPIGPSYRKAYAFHRSYLEMEKLFRVYVYEEGEPPLFHDGPCMAIYSVEGRFIYNMEMENRLRTRDPDQAHVHFLPFSVVRMVQYIYQPNSFDLGPLRRTIKDYINVISQKYPYWNRSLGADHFMLSCHDWGPHASRSLSHLYSNSIRVLCNANTSEGFHPSKDVSLPEINLKIADVVMGGPSASGRPILAFFAGGMHGPVRPMLLKHWRDKDKDMQIHEYLPKGASYYDMMRKSRFCICPSGYEVASPRIVEAIYLECVPVTINDHYVLPFSDVLNWKAFSVQVSMEDIPKLKQILMSISPRQYIRMQRRVKLVQRHFVVNSPPKRFDVFHMILHSIWLRRLNVRIHP